MSPTLSRNFGRFIVTKKGLMIWLGSPYTPLKKLLWKQVGKKKNFLAKHFAQSSEPEKSNFCTFRAHSSKLLSSTKLSLWNINIFRKNLHDSGKKNVVRIVIFSSFLFSNNNKVNCLPKRLRKPFWSDFPGHYCERKKELKWIFLGKEILAISDLEIPCDQVS